MRAVVVSRFPIYRDALVRLVDSTFGPDCGEGFAGMSDALDASSPATSLMLVEASADAPSFADLRAAVDAIKPAPVLLFASLSPGEIQAVHDAGVKGCIPKTAAPDLAAAALRLVLAGGLYFSGVSSLTARQPADPPLRSRLSVRQREALKLIEIGQTNKEIAKALGISVATVKLHVQAILNVTGARNRTEAALRARGQIG